MNLIEKYVFETKILEEFYYAQEYDPKYTSEEHLTHIKRDCRLRLMESVFESAYYADERVYLRIIEEIRPGTLPFMLRFTVKACILDLFQIG